MSEDHFHLPLPPPAGRDVVYFTHRVDEVEPEDGREAQDIMLRSVPRATAQRFRAAAGGRGMTHAQYLAALVELHELIRSRSDGGDTELAGELERLGLATVTV